MCRRVAPAGRSCVRKRPGGGRAGAGRRARGRGRLRGTRGAVAGHRGFEVQQSAQRPRPGADHQVLAGHLGVQPRRRRPGVSGADPRNGSIWLSHACGSPASRWRCTAVARWPAGKPASRPGPNVFRGGPDDLLVPDNRLPLPVRVHGGQHARRLPSATGRPQLNIASLRPHPRHRAGCGRGRERGTGEAEPRVRSRSGSWFWSVISFSGHFASPSTSTSIVVRRTRIRHSPSRRSSRSR